MIKILLTCLLTSLSFFCVYILEETQFWL